MRKVLRLGVCFALALSLVSCNRQAASKAPTEETNSPDGKTEAQGGSVVNAAWYDVPLFSLAKRRAGIEEMTAAHNRLPIGTRVRVTRLANGKSVTVRITDRGIHDRHVKLDLCKEAATELGMISKGVARVRMQVLPADENQPGVASPAAENVAAQQ